MFDASFAGQLVLRSVGLVEWHAEGGSSGFVLSTGAGGSGGGFAIAAFGDADLAVIGDCCNDDEQQGPDAFADGESIASTDLVLWYAEGKLP